MRWLLRRGADARGLGDDVDDAPGGFFFGARAIGDRGGIDQREQLVFFIVRQRAAEIDGAPRARLFRLIGSVLLGRPIAWIGFPARQNGREIINLHGATMTQFA